MHSMSLWQLLVLQLWGLCSRVLLPVAFCRYWWLGRREVAYRQRWRERLGFVAAPDRGCLWVHAVSLGEVQAASLLLETLLATGVRLMVTCGTPAGSAQVLKIFADRVQHSYVPLDTPGSVRRFLRRTEPAALVLMEAELWPFMLHSCAQQGVPVLLANARITASSAVGYQRFSALSRPLAALIQHALARTEDDRQRLLEMGFDAANVELAGDLKYSLPDVAELGHSAQALAQVVGLPKQRSVLVAGSTHAGEEEQVLEAMEMIWARQPELLLILAPRQPRRFGAVAELLEQRKLQFCRHSHGDKIQPDTSVLLLDSIGSLRSCYVLATVAFVGGSLVAGGGHNLLEPAAVGCPLLAGTSLDNFKEASERLLQVGGMRIVRDAQELAEGALGWLEDEKARFDAGKAGRQLVAEHQGSLQVHARAVQSLLKAG